MALRGVFECSALRVCHSIILLATSLSSVTSREAAARKQRDPEIRARRRRPVSPLYFDYIIIINSIRPALARIDSRRLAGATGPSDFRPRL